MRKNHWGIPVDSEVPTTGVIHICSASWFNEATCDGDNLAYHEHMHGNGPCVYCDGEETDHEDCFFPDASDTILIGFIFNQESGTDGEWEIDSSAEYSAIVGEAYAQVIKSKWVLRSALCSPCYPGQGDLDTPGDFLAYCLPPDIFDKSTDDFRIDEIKAV